jgi:acyl-CoA dehydrogenase
MIDFEPSEDQALIIETVRQFAEKEIRPRARECDEGDALPADVLDQAHELGLIANGLPEAYGGGGEDSAVTGCLIAEELAYGDLSTALGILSPGLIGIPVARYGSDDQKQALLPRLCAADSVPGSLALCEPDFDFDAYRPRTQAVRDGDDYVLNGHKCQVPNQVGDLPILVIASEGDDTQGFLVPREAAGMTITPESNLGVRALPTAELLLEDVRVPASARLGGEAGADIRHLISRGRIALATLAVGVSRAACELSVDYAKQRETFGAPIATRQAIAFKLADMAIEIDGARLLTWEAAWRLDQGEDVTREATLAYDQAKRIALDVADGAVQVFGGHGYIRDYLPEMLLRNASGFASFEALCLV